MKSTKEKLLGIVTVTLITLAACQKRHNEPDFNRPSNQQLRAELVDIRKEGGM